MKISVIGKVSVGKSSFINTLHGVFMQNKKSWSPICTVSLQRETVVATEYVYSNDLNVSNYEVEKSKNKTYRESSLPPLTVSQVSVGENPWIHSITDFPGIDDGNDTRGCFGFFLQNMGDVTFWITEAPRAFVDGSENKYFERVCQISAELQRNGTFHQVVIVVTKFDDATDEDLQEIFAKNVQPKSYQIFRWCSYGFLRGLESSVGVPKSFLSEFKKARSSDMRCDIDGLAKFIQEFDIDRKKISHATDYWCNFTGHLTRQAASNIMSLLNSAKKYNLDGKLAQVIFYSFLKGVYWDLPTVILEYNFHIDCKIMCQDSAVKLLSMSKMQLTPEWKSFLCKAYLIGARSFHMNPEFKQVCDVCIEGWEVIESWHGAAWAPKFPAQILETLGVNTRNLIRHCYANLKGTINVFAF